MKKVFAKSLQLLERAKKITPLGAQTYSKSYRYLCEGNAPVFLERGDGCLVWDIDGNQYVDYICALGPIVIGYNNEKVNNAIIEQLSKGISFSLSTPLEVELAEMVSEIIPYAEMIRFVKNGSDATTAAIRLARAYTGKEMVLVCGYHGMHDWYIGSTENNRGVPEAVKKLTKSFGYNDIESVQRLFKEYPDKIAAVILEPIQGKGPKDGFLKELKKIVHNNSAILIYDEVVSGFRYALGGAAEIYGVTPDLAAFGKGMANGMPLSALAGKQEIMRLIEEGVFVSTTFGGETLSLAGAIATINILKQSDTYEHINCLGELVLKGLSELVKKHQLETVVQVDGIPAHAYLNFEGAGSLDYLDIASIYQQRLLQEGILSLGIFNLSLSHSQSNIKQLLEASDKALSDIVQAIKQDSTEGILLGGKMNPVFKRNPKSK
ncbi:aminotransferase class III-fold pyridoxal phosphate-dependent enzyme [Azotosporobacter soli]|uniref:aminotransferase class III-fold pyridoxal phosphate-dependent enzyme n=1 Tax=Azotosporobacter soli TaxID=3055040 RepID=UPI0031FE9FFD